MPRNMEDWCVCWNEFIILTDWVVDTEEAAVNVIRYWMREYPEYYVSGQCSEIHPTQAGTRDVN